MTSGSSTSTATLPRLGARPWVMLALGFLAQTATSMLTSTPAFLIPQLHAHGVPLATAGLLASTTTIGMVIALVAWGALADRIGERWVLSGGLLLAAIAAAGAMLTSTNFVALSLFFVLGGIASASSSPASGRLVTGWFPKNRRGLAMGIRQGSQPLGVALAALVVPPLAANGIPAAALASVVFCGVIGIVGALVLRDPARPEASAAPHLTANPYRSDSTLVRIHLVSILLVIPQFTISTFGFVWLVEAQRLPVPLAGAIVGLAQLIGAVGRIGVGVWSDRLGSRMRPLRWVALAAVASMLLLALVGLFFAPVVASILIIVAATITVADNGLAFGAVAEIAGPFWSGRALGAQNTGQWIGASLVGPLAGLLIGAAGYPITFVAAAVCALVAVPLVPSAGDREHGTPAPVAEGSASR